MTDIVEELKIEAACTEELHPQDSEIATMRRAAVTIETLRDALKALVFAATSPALSAEDRGLLSQSVTAARTALNEASQ